MGQQSGLAGLLVLGSPACLPASERSRNQLRQSKPSPWDWLPQGLPGPKAQEGEGPGGEASVHRGRWEQEDPKEGDGLGLRRVRCAGHPKVAQRRVCV